MRLCLPPLMLVAVAALAAQDRQPVPQPPAPRMTFDGWTPIFRGIDFGRGRIRGGVAGDSTVESLRIDLAAPGVIPCATPGDGPPPHETIAEPASEFLRGNGLAVATNACFYGPCCRAAYEPKGLVGLAASHGELVSPPVLNGETGAAALTIIPGGPAQILYTFACPDLTTLHTAVSGSEILLRDGVVFCSDDRDEGFFGPNPRTAAGVSADGRTLYLVTIDGRQPGYSAGVTLRETAEWLALLGASNGLNLDGGGSTAMVRTDGDNGFELLNRPSGGRERFNGSHLGFHADPLPAGPNEP